MSNGAFQPKFRPQSKIPDKKVIRTSTLHSSKKKDSKRERQKFLRVQEPKRQTFSDKPQTIFGEQARPGDRLIAEPRSDSKHERLKFLKTEKLHSSSHKERHPRL